MAVILSQFAQEKRLSLFDAGHLGLLQVQSNRPTGKAALHATHGSSPKFCRISLLVPDILCRNVAFRLRVAGFCICTMPGLAPQPLQSPLADVLFSC
jgi:hypothetical protein